jgi:hypothetical protein
MCFNTSTSNNRPTYSALAQAYVTLKKAFGDRQVSVSWFLVFDIFSCGIRKTDFCISGTGTEKKEKWKEAKGLTNPRLESESHEKRSIIIRDSNAAYSCHMNALKSRALKSEDCERDMLRLEIEIDFPDFWKQ